MRAALAAAIVSVALNCAAARAGPVGAPVESTLAALAGQLDPRAASTLASIDGTGRRLLAARAYLRAASQMEERWSWSTAEAAAFAGSPEKLALDAAIARVRCSFESDNPGHTLWVNPEFRSLEVQLERWNDNETVARAGEDLLEVARYRLAAVDEGRADAAGQVAALRSLLLEHQPMPVPTLAAPGLSPHGRMRAIDFQVESSGRIVAGTDSAAIASVWVAAGWKARLQVAIAIADAGFHGPLQAPDEPWHYDFRPQAGHTEAAHGPACSPAT